MSSLRTRYGKSGSNGKKLSGSRWSRRERFRMLGAPGTWGSGRLPCMIFQISPSQPAFPQSAWCPWCPRGEDRWNAVGVAEHRTEVADYMVERRQQLKEDLDQQDWGVSGCLGRRLRREPGAAEEAAEGAAEGHRAREGLGQVASARATRAAMPCARRWTASTIWQRRRSLCSQSLGACH